MSNLRPYEIILILLVILLLFGAKRLPDAARGLGRSLRIFKAETKGLRDDDAPEETGYSDPHGPRPAPRPEPRPIVSAHEDPLAAPHEAPVRETTTRETTVRETPAHDTTAREQPHRTER
jgi:sec-independent protein translocase protein TatA